MTFYVSGDPRLTLLKDVFRFAHWRGLFVMVTGGYAVDFALGRLTRDHHDVDLMVEEEDLDAWGSWFAERGFVRRDYLSKNRKLCFALDRGDIHVDLGSLYFDGEKVLDRCDADGKPFVWPAPKSRLSAVADVGGTPFRYAAPEVILAFKTGHPSGAPRAKDAQDVALLKGLLGR